MMFLLWILPELQSSNDLMFLFDFIAVWGNSKNAALMFRIGTTGHEI